MLFFRPMDRRSAPVRVAGHHCALSFFLLFLPAQSPLLFCSCSLSLSLCVYPLSPCLLVLCSAISPYYFHLFFSCAFFHCLFFSLLLCFQFSSLIHHRISQALGLVSEQRNRTGRALFMNSVLIISLSLVPPPVPVSVGLPNTNSPSLTVTLQCADACLCSVCVCLRVTSRLLVPVCLYVTSFVPSVSLVSIYLSSASVSPSFIVFHSCVALSLLLSLSLLSPLSVPLSGCPALPSPANGLSSCTDATHTYTECQFSCNGDYYLVGRVSIVCNGSVWSAQAPTCSQDGACMLIG